MSQIILSELPQNVVNALDETTRRLWDSLPEGEQICQLRKVAREFLYNVGASYLASFYGTPAAQIDYYLGKLLFADPTKKSFTLDDTRKYCCAELGMTIYDFESKDLAEIASLLKTAYEKKIGLERKAEEKSAVGPAAKLDVDDDLDYIAAKDCRNDTINSPRKLNELLKKVPNDDRGIRRRYRGQHLRIHAGDWLRWQNTQTELGLKALDQTEKAIQKLQATTSAGKSPKKKSTLATKLIGRLLPDKKTLGQ